MMGRAKKGWRAVPHPFSMDLDYEMEVAGLRAPLKSIEVDGDVTTVKATFLPTTPTIADGPITLYHEGVPLLHDLVALPNTVHIIPGDTLEVIIPLKHVELPTNTWVLS